MKKRTLKSLKLNKKTISNPQYTIVFKGGVAGTHYASICDCPDTFRTAPWVCNSYKI